ncbi:MAG: hypothetical protein NW224_19950 [Leptolyngbyaceae cyanobacterium bins.302]|nr:hypothetical protein [Leptolyngbyaceae cyanobacterium bins.302]
MSHDQSSSSQRSPAPCIVDTGTIINKHDMHRLLTDIGRVRYTHTQDGVMTNHGDGCILEVFSDPCRATLVANHAMYLNVQSFDYLELGLTEDDQPYFDLIQDSRILRLIPLTNPLMEEHSHDLNAAALEAVVAEVLAAGWDVQIDDEEPFSL